MKTSLFAFAPLLPFLFGVPAVHAESPQAAPETTLASPQGILAGSKVIFAADLPETTLELVARAKTGSLLLVGKTKALADLTRLFEAGPLAVKITGPDDFAVATVPLSLSQAEIYKNPAESGTYLVRIEIPAENVSETSGAQFWLTCAAVAKSDPVATPPPAPAEVPQEAAKAPEPAKPLTTAKDRDKARKKP